MNANPPLSVSVSQLALTGHFTYGRHLEHMLDHHQLSKVHIQKGLRQVLSYSRMITTLYYRVAEMGP